MEIKEILKKLTSETGVSGDEFPASRVAAELLKQYTDDVTIDEFGDVVGFIKSDNPDAKTLMLDAHIDRVGMIVTYIDKDGFLNVNSSGGADEKTMLAQSVTVHGKKDIPGVVCTLPPHVAKEKGEAPEITDIRIDVGMSKEQAEQVISLGDLITVNSCFRELQDNIVSTPGLDDRSGVCVLLAAVDKLGGKKPAYNVAVCFTVGEEVGGSGARHAAFRIQPDEAIAADVSFGRTPDSKTCDTVPLGSGAMIGFSPTLNKDMSNRLKSIAAEKKIPFTVEVMSRTTGTNADPIGISGKGVKCATVSFPIRYMHTSIETMDIRDIDAAAELICEYMRCAND